MGKGLFCLRMKILQIRSLYGLIDQFDQFIYYIYCLFTSRLCSESLWFIRLLAIHKEINE